MGANTILYGKLCTAHRSIPSPHDDPNLRSSRRWKSCMLLPSRYTRTPKDHNIYMYSLLLSVSVLLSQDEAIDVERIPKLQNDHHR